MENKTPQNRRTAYSGRFGSVTESAPRRTTAPARSRTAGMSTQSGRRPSGFAPAAPEKRRTAARPTTAKPASAKPAAAKAPRREKRQEPIRNKRTQRRRDLPLWQKLLLIGIPLLLVFIIVIVLVFGGDDGTYHQLPKVERGSSSAFTPEETNAPEGAGAFGDVEETADESFEIDEAAVFDAIADSEGFEGFLDGADGADTFDETDAASNADFFGDFDGFGDDADLDDAAILDQLIAFEEARE